MAMFARISAAMVIALALAGAATAATVEVEMLNKGEEGTMVFEPAFVRIQPGDTVKFIAADKGHNAESIKGMIPEGAEPFAGKINEEIEVTLEAPGIYGVMCKPHFAMGMVMTIAAGDEAEMPANYLEGRLPPKAKQRLENSLSNL
nr:pseudoazurin [Notoacmeibacter marinus]